MAITGIDKRPLKFILKVYETKALAEEGDENNALYVFSNGTDTDAADETVANGSQFVSGKATASSSGVTLKDTSARFGTRLVGKKVKNYSADDGATASGKKEGTVAAFVSETELTIDTNMSWSTDAQYIFDSPSHFFTFQKYFYRFESTDVVTGFVVDWDDGEDNSPEKANRQVIKLDTPSYYAVAAHTYTTHGLHFPMIRTIDTEGFYSKWYTGYDALASGLSSIETQTLPAGQNAFSIVSLDNDTIPRIPSFAPANSAPIGVLKTDRSIVYSGIDNAPLDGTTIANPLVYCYVERAGGNELSAYTGRIQVVWEDATGQIKKDVVGAHSNVSSITASHTVGTASALFVKRILSAKLLNLSEATTAAEEASMLRADERVILFGISTTGSAANSEAPHSDPVITMLSLGNPIQYLDRPGFYAILDGSQSQTRCSNVDIDSYIFDTDELEGVTLSTGAADFYYGAGMAEQISDILGVPLGVTNPFLQSDSSLRVSYSFAPNASVLSSSSGNVIDKTTMRFFNDERLVRLQVIDSSATTRTDASRPFENTHDSGANTAEIVSAGESAIDVDNLSKFNIGDVITFDSDAVHPETGMDLAKEQMYVSDVGDGSDAGTLTVSRQYNDTAVDPGAPRASGVDLHILDDNGALGDSFTHSFVEHWTRKGYADFVVRPDSFKSRALLMYATDVAPNTPLGVMHWKAKEGDYKLNTRIMLDSSTASTGEVGLIFGGAVHGTDSSTNGTQLAGSAAGVPGMTGTEAPKPSNFLLMCKTEKFNKIHLRMKNNWSLTARASECTSDIIWTASHRAQLYLWYTARTSPTATTYRWKALSFRDGTSCRTYDEGDTENNSLRVSGSITFDMPSDWVDVKSSDLTWDDTAEPVSDETGGSLDIDPASEWIDNMYGLMLGIAIDTDPDVPAYANWRCVSVQAYNNAHSQAMTIVDPHHKSLNDIAITQSISWSRSGKYIDISNRMGSTEIRKIGAEGGSITFGGVELSGNYDTQKKLLNIYQREGTPVYLDVQRAVDKGEYIRFFGILTDMSEDYPAGMQHPKFGLTMSISHVCEYDRNNNTASTSNWIGRGLMSLGGEIIDVTDFAP